MKIRHAQPDPPLLAAQQRREDKGLDHPLVPHLPVVGPAPHADFQLRVVREVERCLYDAPGLGQPFACDGIARVDYMENGKGKWPGREREKKRKID